MLGITAMLHRMYSWDDKSGVEALMAHKGAKIASAEISDSAGQDGGLLLAFDDGCTLALYDDGRSCCESRYMTTDEDLSGIAGRVLVDVELNDAPDVEDEYGETHEIQFLRVITDGATYVFASHNEHNGYYGGIDINVKIVSTNTDDEGSDS